MTRTVTATRFIIARHFGTDVVDGEKQEYSVSIFVHCDQGGRVNYVEIHSLNVAVGESTGWFDEGWRWSAVVCDSGMAAEFHILRPDVPVSIEEVVNEIRLGLGWDVEMLPI